MMMSLLMLLLAGGNAEAKKYKPAPRTAKNIVIAHRGYWNTPGAFENSIKAIDNAMNFGIYGSEFDINFTADDSIEGSRHPGIDLRQGAQYAAGQRREGADAARISACRKERSVDAADFGDQETSHARTRKRDRGQDDGNGRGAGAGKTRGVHLVQLEHLRADPQGRPQGRTDWITA